MSLHRLFCHNMALPLLLAVTMSLSAFCCMAENTQKHYILLPPLSLQDALVSVSHQTGVSIYADDNLLRGLDSPAIEGNFTVKEVLLLLLKNNHLIYRQQEQELFVILPEPQLRSSKEKEVKTQTPVVTSLPMEEVVVTGSRIWNRDTGFARKRHWVDSNAFLSKDVITQYPGLSVPDIIDTMPGVTAFSDMRLGQAATSEAEYLSVRNMGSAYTSTFIDGVPIESADMTTRSLSLKTLVPVNTGSVRIMKTPGSEWEGLGIGGALNIQTPDAFTLGADYLRLTTGTNYSELRKDRDLGNDGRLFSAEWADLFHDNQLGVYFSGYVQQRYTAAESIEVGSYSPDKQSDTNLVTLPLYPNDIRFDFYQSVIRRKGGSLALDWRQPEAKYFLRTSYNHYDSNGYDVQMKLARGEQSQYSATGDFLPEGVTTNGYFQSRDTFETLATFLLGGSNQLRNSLSVNYAVSTSFSRIQRPYYVESSLNSPVHDGDFSFDVSNPEVSVLMFDSPATKNFLLSQDSVRVRKFQGHDDDNRNSMVNGKFEIKWQPKQLIDDVTAAFTYHQSNRYHHSRPLTGDSGGNFYIPMPNGQIPEPTNPQGPSVSSLDRHNIAFMNGTIANFPVYERDYFETSLLPFAYHDLFTSTGVANPGEYTEDDWNRNTVEGGETIRGFYVTASKAIGNFIFVPGLYLDDYRFNAKRWNVEVEPYHFSDITSGKTTLLPSLNIRYQIEPNLFFRSSVRKAMARASFGDLAGPTAFYYDKGSDELLEIVRKKPRLQPQQATNIDLSVEWYPTAETLTEATVYTKDVRNMIYSEQSQISYQGSDITLTQPVNGNRANLMGVDFHARHRLRSNNWILDGWGVDLSMNLQHSETRSQSSSSPKNTQIPLTPGQSYKIQLFHESADLRLTLQWLYTGKQLLTYTDSGMDKYLQPYETLDFLLMYRMASLTFNLQINNLLDQSEFYKTLGETTDYLGTQDDGGNGSYVETGRYASLYLSWSF